MLEARNISFAYSDPKVIDSVSFTAAKGKQVAVIGESGCGKSTLLKLLYGLHDLDEGLISLNGNPVLGPKYNLIPGHEKMKYLAQDFGLMPYITVAENVGNFLSNIYKDKKRERIAELLQMVEMTEYADVKAQFLSGGQQQRTALAKVLALEPEVLLLDEPFSQIDTFRANALRRNLFKYFREKEITCIMATHDSIDVLSFSDETLVMKDGKIVAAGNPKTIYSNPESRYVASLFGDVNNIPTQMLGSENRFVYPHQLIVVKQSNFTATVTNSWFKGDGYRIEALCQFGKIYFDHSAALPKSMMVCLSLRK
jgi:ABC-type Fe3+/spermidine/putrescine transport system ATPase subunit